MTNVKKEQTYLDMLNAKRMVQHPKYPWLKVDMRTTREVEESRRLKPWSPILRLARSARRQGKMFHIKRDLDGAFRIAGRLDEGKALKSTKFKGA